MPKLYFRYGTMGSSKTANCLMTRFNYLEKGYEVLLLKPSIDNRDGTDIIKSRIGLEAKALTFDKNTYLAPLFMKWKNRLKNNNKIAVIVDEGQFSTLQQINELKYIATKYCNVFVYGLRTNFKTNLFEGSKRLFELADSINEIKSICHCGSKAIVNARIDDNGNVVSDGEEVLIGGNDTYIGLCYDCWLSENTGKVKNIKTVEDEIVRSITEKGMDRYRDSLNKLGKEAEIAIDKVGKYLDV